MPAAVALCRKIAPPFESEQNHLNSGDAAGPAALWTSSDSLARSLYKMLSSFSGRRRGALRWINSWSKGEEDRQKATVSVKDVTKAVPRNW